MNFQPLLDQWPLIAGGIQVTLVASVAASLISVATGGLLGVFSQFANKTAYRLIRAFIYFFRGIPLLVLLFLSYYALPSLGLNLSGLAAGILAFGFNSGAYMTEVVRSALESVDESQREAAQLDGASEWTTMTRVIFPQASRQMVAPGTNQLVNLMKGTSLLSVVSVADLTRSTQLVASADFVPFEAFISLGIIYLIFTTILTRASVQLERWLDIALLTSGPRSTSR